MLILAGGPARFAGAASTASPTAGRTATRAPTTSDGVAAAALGGPAGPFTGPRIDTGPSPVDAAEVNDWVASTLGQAPRQASPFDTIDTCVESEMAQTGTPGASVAIAVDGVITYTKGYGVKDLDNGGTIDAETQFRIGSTTKMMTAAAVMQLAEQGRVNLDAPVTQYLPDLKLAAPWDASTIHLHHLLSHTADLPDTYLIQDVQTSLADWAGTLQYMPLNAPPGSFWNYANPNFSLAGLVVQQVSGEPYQSFVQDHVWGPAGMPRTTFDPDVVVSAGDFAVGHEGDIRYMPADWDYPAVAPAGTAFSTPTDLANWALLLSDGGAGVLDPDSVTAMESRQTSLDYVPWMDYGYGVFVTDYQEVADPSQHVTVYDHGGNVPGFSSQLYWIPEQGFAVSILANTITSLTGSAHCALQVLAGVEPIPTAPRVTDASTWGPHPGTYAMMNVSLWPFTAHIALEDDKLRVRYADIGDSLLVQKQFSLLNIFDRTFLIDANDDGTPDSNLDFTFIPDRTDGLKDRWYRDRLLVGQRLGEFPERVALRGTECAPVTVTAGMDFPEMHWSATGLSAPVALRGVPTSQDDPADPSTASFKRSIKIRGGADLVWVNVAGEADDALGLYLLLDANGDGTFSFPQELVAVGSGSGSQQILYMTQRAPEGLYQLWVHGQSVQGDASQFDMDIRIVEGSDLALKDAPASLNEGETTSLQVCGTSVARFKEPQLGLVQLDYGAAPRLARIMVDWSPAPPRIFLPMAANQ
jgi:CubicO group peptidase (beta-lactamase class C family)